MTGMGVCGGARGWWWWWWWEDAGYRNALARSAVSRIVVIEIDHSLMTTELDLKYQCIDGTILS